MQACTRVAAAGGHVLSLPAQTPQVDDVHDKNKYTITSIHIRV